MAEYWHRMDGKMFASVGRSYLLAAASAFAVLAGVVPAGAAGSQPDLQQLADQAALAGVTALGTSEAQSLTERRDEVIQATQKIISPLAGIEAQIAASLETLTVSVSLADSKDSKLHAASTAYYVPPEQLANWSWAPRHNFALKRSPVVLGSNCLQDCGVDAVR